MNKHRHELYISGNGIPRCMVPDCGKALTIAQAEAILNTHADLLEALEELIAERDSEDWSADTGGIVLARMAIQKARES